MRNCDRFRRGKKQKNLRGFTTISARIGAKSGVFVSSPVIVKPQKLLIKTASPDPAADRRVWEAERSTSQLMSPRLLSGHYPLCLTRRSRHAPPPPPVRRRSRHAPPPPVEGGWRGAGGGHGGGGGGREEAVTSRREEAVTSRLHEGQRWRLGKERVMETERFAPECGQRTGGAFQVIGMESKFDDQDKRWRYFDLDSTLFILFKCQHIYVNVVRFSTISI